MRRGRATIKDPDNSPILRSRAGIESRQFCAGLGREPGVFLGKKKPRRVNAEAC